MTMTAQKEGLLNYVDAKDPEIADILKDELAGPLHALSMETLTTEEWAKKGGIVRESPDCLGGSKHNN